MGKLTWTKRPRYKGFQSTMDSNDNMRELKPSSISTIPFTNTWRLEKDPLQFASANGEYDAKLESSAPVNLERHNCDTGYTELDKSTSGMKTASNQQQASEDLSILSSPHLSPSDPLMDELDNLIQGSERKDPMQHSSENMSFEKSAQPTSAAGSHGQDTIEVKLFRRPGTGPIPHDELVAEVKAIYTNLAMSEAKCLELDNRLRTIATCRMSGEEFLEEQFRASRELHQRLIHEHYDFFYASQHPAAGLALQSLAAKYAMPVRMWRHGVQGFVKAMCHQPHPPLSEMRSFLQETRSTLQKLTQVAPALIDEWTEMIEALSEYEAKLGDLARGASSGHTISSDSTPNIKEILSHKPPDRPENEFGDWYSVAADYHSVATDPPDSSRTPLCSIRHQLQLPRHVLESLAGWLIYGQGLASSSFNTYCKVFFVMSLTAIKHTSWVPGLL